jgi:hypothetical protein
MADWRMGLSSIRALLESPVQAMSALRIASYFYRYTQLLSLRKETEGALGTKFNQLRSTRQPFADAARLGGLGAL